MDKRTNKKESEEKKAMSSEQKDKFSLEEMFTKKENDLSEVMKKKANGLVDFKHIPKPPKNKEK